MDFKELAAQAHTIANSELFDIGGRSVTTYTFIIGLVIVAVAFLLSELTQRGIVRALKKRGIDDEHGAGAMGRLLHYGFVSLGIFIALETAGIQLSTFFAAGAIFAVGIGFAMQNIAQNFVSGLILLIERSIKPGDVLEIQGETVRVVEMGIRATHVRTLNEEIMVVPNSTIVQSTVKSLTLKGSVLRIRVIVGVTYSSDMDLVEKTLLEAARALDWRSPTRDPAVILVDFGDSSVNWEVSVWISDPWQVKPLRGKVRKAIWDAFKAQNITIAFPQLDIHFDPPVEEALIRSRAA